MHDWQGQRARVHYKSNAMYFGFWAGWARGVDDDLRIPLPALIQYLHGEHVQLHGEDDQCVFGDTPGHRGGRQKGRSLRPAFRWYLPCWSARTISVMKSSNRAGFRCKGLLPHWRRGAAGAHALKTSYGAGCSLQQVRASRRGPGT